MCRRVVSFVHWMVLKTTTDEIRKSAGEYEEEDTDDDEIVQ